MMKHLVRTRRSGFTQFLFFVLTIVLLLAGIAQADWNPPTFFSTAKQYDLLTQSAGDLVEGPDGTLHAVWTEYDRTLDWPATAAIIAIRYSRSTDGGASWSPATTITSTSFIYSYYGNPRITVSDAGRIHLTYYYLNYYGYSTVNYAKSNDRGQTWEITGLQNGCFPWFRHLRLIGTGMSTRLGNSGSAITAIYRIWFTLAGRSIKGIPGSPRCQ